MRDRNRSGRLCVCKNAARLSTYGHIYVDLNVCWNLHFLCEQRHYRRLVTKLYGQAYTAYECRLLAEYSKKKKKKLIVPILAHYFHYTLQRKRKIANGKRT